jgi:hypothetical protein
VHAVLIHDRWAAAAGPDRVAVLDASASVSDFTMARVTDMLDRHPGVGIVFIGPPPVVLAREGAVVPGSRWLRLAARHGVDEIASRRAVLRRTTFERCGPQTLGTRTGELALWLRAAAVSDVGWIVEPGRDRPTKPTRSGSATELYELTHAFRALFEGFAPMADQRQLRSGVYRAIARRARARALAAALRGDRAEATLSGHLAADLVQRLRR